MPEKEIEQYLAARTKSLGGWALKFISPGVAGVPDRIVLMPGGQIFFAELKRPGAKARPLQAAIHRRLERLGFAVYVIDNREQIETILSTYRR